MKKMRISIVFALAVGLLALGLPAKACSCFQGDPYDALANADAAFIGEFVASHDPNPPGPGDPYSSGDPIIYTFTVEEESKGEFGDSVDVVAARDGASCGLEVQPGERYGLLLYGSAEEGWNSGLCSQMDPDRLHEVAQGLPAPDGEGPVKAIVGGSFGPATSIALDEQGRTLGYGYAEGDTYGLSVCEGSQHFVEVVSDLGQRPRLLVRETKSMKVMSTMDLPLSSGFEGLQFGGVQCRDADGAEVAVLGLKYPGNRPRSAIWSVRGSSAKVVYSGTARAAAFYGDLVYMREGKKGRVLSYFDLNGGGRVKVGNVPRRAGLSMSPDLSKVAGLRSDGTLTVADLTKTPVGLRERVLGYGTGGDVLWLDDQTLMLAPGGFNNSNVLLFDSRLRSEESLQGDWYTLHNALAGDTALGVGWGSLYRVQLPDGPAEMIRFLPTEVTNAVVPITDEVLIENPE